MMLGSKKYGGSNYKKASIRDGPTGQNNEAGPERVKADACTPWPRLAGAFTAQRALAYFVLCAKCLVHASMSAQVLRTVRVHVHLRPRNYGQDTNTI